MVRLDPESNRMRSRSSNDLLTSSELADRLGIKPATVLDWYRKGRIPALKISPKVLRFNLTEVLAALAPTKPQGDA